MYLQQNCGNIVKGSHYLLDDEEKKIFFYCPLSDVLALERIGLLVRKDDGYHIDNHKNVEILLYN